ncbi:ABC-type uncharacterized transport system permease subunit [Bradyrhizobium elkanii]|nr:ABC-type uncharacterized transport system permease subunit [Bradyrhizobium elkanii]
MDFRYLPLSFIVPWPVMILIGIGCLSILGAIGLGVWWLVSHLQWIS